MIYENISKLKKFEVSGIDQILTGYLIDKYKNRDILQYRTVVKYINNIKDTKPHYKDGRKLNKNQTFQKIQKNIDTRNESKQEKHTKKKEEQKEAVQTKIKQLKSARQPKQSKYYVSAIIYTDQYDPTKKRKIIKDQVGNKHYQLFMGQFEIKTDSDFMNTVLNRHIFKNNNLEFIQLEKRFIKYTDFKEMKKNKPGYVSGFYVLGFNKNQNQITLILLKMSYY